MPREVKMKETNWMQAVIGAIDQEMERDPSIFIMGEGVAHVGGTAGCYHTLFEKYGPGRVKDTPISETAIIGAAIGAAMTGMRPLADLLFCSFLGIAWEEITNSLSKMRYSFGGQGKLPVVVKALIGAGRGLGSAHSQSIEGILMGIPGLKIVIPSTPYDAKGLIKSALREDNPVIFFEHTMLRMGGPTSMIPEEDYTIPLGKADIKREGSDITVVATALMVHRALSAAVELQKKGISIEVIDPRTLVPLDKPAIIDSVKKTGRLVIMTEETKTGSSAAEIAAIVAEEALDYLDAPIRRVNAPDTAVPFSPALEKFFMPSEKDLIRAITEIM